MPIYEYVCSQCELKQEHLHKMDESVNEPCDGCGAPPEALIKVLSVFAKHGSWGNWNVGQD